MTKAARVEEMPVHPVAALFPMMTRGGLQELAKDIADNGLIESITTYCGQILDGRNRLAACRIADVDPEFWEYTGDEDTITDWILGKNLHRRQLTASQRAMVASKLARLPRGVRKSHASRDASQDDAAEALNVGRASVQRAREVEERGAPELVQAVESGSVPVSVAAKAAQAPKSEQRKAVKAGPAAVKALAKQQDEPEPDEDPLAGIDRTAMVTNFSAIDKCLKSLEKKLAEAQIISTAGVVNDAVIAEYLKKSKRDVDLSMLRVKAERVQRCMKHLLNVMNAQG